MTRVPLVQTGGYDTDAWIRRVYPAARNAARVAVPMTDTFEHDAEGDAEREATWNVIACCAVANWGHVSGWGGLEYGNNVGLVLCGHTNDNCMLFAAEYGGEMMRAFPALPDGVVAWVAWVRASSRDTWSRFELGGLDYWDAFQRVTHRGSATADEALRAFDRVAVLMGVAGMDAVETELIRHEWHAVRPGQDASRVPPLTVVRGRPPRVPPGPPALRPPAPDATGGGASLGELLGFVSVGVGIAKALDVI